jgi:hypothetical protein
MTPEIGVIVGAVFTLLIMSYLLGDNFLYRFATHILVGAGAGYILVVVVANVLVPYLLVPFISTVQTQQAHPGLFVAVLGFFFGFLLLFKLRPRWAFVGNASIGYLVGVGAAVTLGGALFGTLAPQIEATATPSLIPLSDNSLLDSMLKVIIPAATLFTLASFGFYRAARGGILSGVNAIGRFFLAIALGATFALVYVASVSLLIERTQAVVDAAKVLLSIK